MRIWLATLLTMVTLVRVPLTESWLLVNVNMPMGMVMVRMSVEERGKGKVVRRERVAGMEYVLLDLVGVIEPLLGVVKEYFEVKICEGYEL